MTGAVSSLWRYPIKSHGREPVDTVYLTAGQTMPWDRTWAVTHEETKFDPTNPQWANCRNFMLSARTPGLAGIWARLDEAARRVTLSHQALGEIKIAPDDRTDVARFLAWVAPLCPPERAAPADIVSVSGRGMTDSDYPSISIMNTATHAAVEQAIGSPLEPERWRGNIWLDGPGPWEEFDWVSGDIRIGGAQLRVREPILRCMATAANPTTGKRDADTLGALNGRFGHQTFGIYAEVVQSGQIAIGDTVQVL